MLLLGDRVKYIEQGTCGYLDLMAYRNCFILNNKRISHTLSKALLTSRNSDVQDSSSIYWVTSAVYLLDS